MIVNSEHLLIEAPIVDMFIKKIVGRESSHGLTEAGYDIRLKQDVFFTTYFNGSARVPVVRVSGPDGHTETNDGKFCLASAMEEFNMPTDLVGVVHDKSTWARKGLSVFNTVVEPGWKGWLTLELVYHGQQDLFIPAGSGIAQVLFHTLALEREYKGKYQNQEDKPVAAR